MPFQSNPIQIQPAPGVEGDFASGNVYKTTIAPEAGYVAGTTLAINGCLVGRFAWADPTDITGRQVINSSATAIVPRGFVLRANNAIITEFLGEATLLIPKGLPVTLMYEGDFFCKITVAAATIGQKAFASLTDGSMQPGEAGATIAGYIETPFRISLGAAVGELAIISN